MRLAASLAALGLLALLPWSCRPEDEWGPGFDLNYQTELLLQPGLTTDVVHHFYFENLNSRYQNLLTQFNKTDADIERIQTSLASIDGVFGDGDFSCIEEVQLRVYSTTDPNNKIEIAYRFPTPLSPGNALPLIPNLPDVKKFLSASRFSLDLAIRLRFITQLETQTRLSLQFRAVYR
jgi:hypothetical protein